MTEPLPKWLMIKYCKLWKKFGKNLFNNAQAMKTLNENDPHLLSVSFYDLNRFGWMNIKRDEKDKRKKLYELRDINKVIIEISHETN